MIKKCATFGPIGSLPASGTLATVLALIPVWLLWGLQVSVITYCGITLVCCIAAVIVTYLALPAWPNVTDPREIVIDELVGTLITFIAIPINIHTTAVGFVLFRLLDIFKPFGIKKIEQSGGVWGIILDDVAAGVVSNIALHVGLLALSMW
jgi:phosphatidylglycerophosphatase A